MNGKQVNTRRGTVAGLLQSLAGNPALPGYIRQLQPPVLKRLIEHVGVADASSLIVHTSPAQMRELFDVVLWESLAPGQPENLRPERFREWLDAMLDAGPTFAAQRLMELGEPFLVSHLHGLIRVFPASVQADHDDEARCRCVLCRLDAEDLAFEVIGDWLIAAVDADAWDTLRSVLLEIDGDDARFLQRVFAGAAERVTARGHVGGSEDVLADTAGERRARRESAGFMTPELASVFLKTTQAADLPGLISERSYDSISAGYFESIRRAADTSTHTPPVAAGEDDELPEPEAPDPAAAAHIRRLDEALQEAEVITGPALLLTGPAEPADSGMLELQRLLEHLQNAEPAHFGDRLAELIFLGNVLMAGAWFQGARFSDAEAARAALATSNLGFDWLLKEASETGRGSRREQIGQLLESPPGIVRLFRIGWRLLQSLPLRCATALIDALQDDHLRARLSRRAWILAEIDSAISQPDLREQIRRGEFEDVADNLHLLTLILEPEASRCLQILIADFPRYPLQLDIGLERSPPRSREVRFLGTVRQLERVERFISEIDRYLKVDG